MKSVPLGYVGLTLIGFFALVQGLTMFPSLATWGSLLLRYQEGRALVPVITVLPFALLLLLGLLLVTTPSAVARFLWPDSAEEQPAAMRDETAVLIFAAAGVLIFAGGLPDLFVAMLTVLMASGGDRAPLQPLAGALARVLLGLVLFFRPQMVLDFWRRKQAPREPRPDARGAA